ncbi:TIR domain-containing protein [Actinosynnema sp. NPDC050436]|uniref:toll/interleukin-1 receptor domain-containing protein n=1 Tax=Actinosynnema sp. NPDC050436 TaxID=3155659 RepID=UPI003406EF8D
MAVDERRAPAMPAKLGERDGIVPVPGPTLPWRVALVLVPYTALSWSYTAKGLRGSDVDGLVAFILAVSGLFVLVQVTWLRGLLRPLSLVLANVVVPVVCGGVWGTMSRGETDEGLTAGVVVGAAAVAAVFWLGDLVQLRRAPRVFVSYRRDDSREFVAELGPLLARRYGARNVFVDTESIAVGEDFRAELATALRRTDLVLAVIGPDWLDAPADDGGRRLDDPADYVRLEIGTALAIGLPVVPLLVGGATLPGPDALPEPLRPLHHLQARVLASAPDAIAGEVGELARRLEDRFRVHVRTSFRDAPRRRLRWRLGVALVAVTVVAQPALLGLQEATSSHRDLHNAALAPDGGLVATAGTTVRLWDTTTGDLVRESPPLATVAALSWSPDGRWLATGGVLGSLVVWDRDTLTAQEFPGQAETVRALSWSSDSTRLAVGDDKGVVRVWTRESSRPVAAFRVAPIGISLLAWAPRQPDLVAAVDTLGGLVVTRFGATDPQPVPDVEAVSITWSPTGERLLVRQGGSPHLVLLDADGTGRTDVVGSTGVVEDAVWSPDGRALAAVTEGFDVKVWLWRVDAPSAPSTLLLQKGAAGGTPAVAWARDGTSVVGSTGDVIKAWRVADGTQVADVPRSTDNHASPLLGWAPDPTRLVEARPRSVVVWDLDEGTEDTTIEVPLPTAVRLWLSS